MKSNAGQIENLDPITKIISFLAIIICIIVTPISRLKDFGLYFLLIMAIEIFSKLIFRQVVKRVFMLLPFVFIIAIVIPFVQEGDVCWSMKIGCLRLHVTHEGIWTFLNIVIKASLSLFLLVVASLTTVFSDFLKGLEMFRVPHLLIMLMSFMYRYIYVLLEEARRLMRARSLRYYGSRYVEQFRVVGYMIGVLFIRTYERAERIYNAMAVRGFTGEIMSVKRFRMSPLDFLFIIVIILCLICIVSGFIYRIEYVNKTIDAHLWQEL
jgi:cobalt/nickel transport system permease protein